MQPRKCNRKRKEEFSFKILFRSVHAFHHMSCWTEAFPISDFMPILQTFIFFIVSPEKNPIITYQL